MRSTSRNSTGTHRGSGLLPPSDTEVEALSFSSVHSVRELAFHLLRFLRFVMVEISFRVALLPGRPSRPRGRR
jgi:hypothetical protein